MSQEGVYRFANRRQAADAVAVLVESDHVADLGVYVVGQEEVFITVKTAGQEALESEWVRGVLRLGSDVTDTSLGKLGLLATLGIPPLDQLGLLLQRLGVVEAYHSKEGAKRFRGYSYRRRRTKSRGLDNLTPPGQVYYNSFTQISGPGGKGGS